MMRNMTLSVCLLAGCILCFLLVSRSNSAQSAADTSGFKPVASVHGLMNGQFVVFTEMMNTIRDPKAKQRIERIEGLAEALAELANVNQYNSEKQDYQDWAKQLRDTSMQIAQEAKKENLDEAKVKQLAETIKTTCGACHDKYQ